MLRKLTLLLNFFVFQLLLNAGKEPGFSNGIAVSASRVAFTENKGQVGDQHYNARHDVLFSGLAGGFSFHLRNTGISYQLSRYESKIVGDTMSTNSCAADNLKKREVSGKIKIYRLDADWIGCNQKFTVVRNEPLQGHTNYYNELCPGGAVRVLSFGNVVYKNIYDGVDVKFYEQDGNLKYDYVVSPEADYTQIKVLVRGATEIRIQEDGALSIRTPMGEIIEDAPLVYQRGIQLPARWKCDNSIVSFKIEGIVPGSELIIDPTIRVWGTYYGGPGGERAKSCSVDMNGNVFICGSADANSGGTMATSGAHQTTYAGGTHTDGLVAKFNGNGVRLWGTYYGGTKSDFFTASATDASGNIYACGPTQSTGSVISSPGSHQPLFGALQDAFLVKFDGAGVRQWATYYGGVWGTEEVVGCATDHIGNVYMSGFNMEAGVNNGTAIATVAAHQTISLGSFECFLVKFNSNGVRQWGTYYGTAAQEFGGHCCTDPSGNVYLAGQSQTPTSTNIATPGCHQPVANSIWTGYLAKFSASGVRLWGTYYGGGSGIEDISSCTTDGSGNVYISGVTAHAGGTVIATPGSHQSIYGGGPSDGFLAKFNGGGVRLWGTYYGGSKMDNGWWCTTDNLGHVFLMGQSASPNGDTIATFCNHQSLYGGGPGDSYFAKFNNAGTRQWGSYFGGSTQFDGITCGATDANGNLFIAGSTTETMSALFATPGAFQTTYGGNIDCFLGKFTECNYNPVTNLTTASNLSVCAPATASLTVSSSGAVSWHSSANGTATIGSGTTLVTPTLSSGTYTYYAEPANTCTVNACRLAISVTANAAPVIAVNSGSACAGNSFTLEPSGAISYTTTGGSFVVSPASTSSYSITGTNSAGCTSTNAAVATVTVHPLPIVSLNSGTICSGESFTIFATGAATYSYSGGINVVSPSVTTTYSVTGTSNEGCESSSPALSTVVVNSRPFISATGGSICAGQHFTITPTGASTYTFSGGSNVVSPSVTTSYSVSGTSSEGCESFSPAVVTVTVVPSVNLIINGPDSLCQGQNILLSVSGASSFTWNTGSTAPFISVGPSVTTTYSVGGENAGGCDGAGTKILYVKPTPIVSVNNVTTCAAESVTLQATVNQSAVSYSWYPDGTTTSSVVVNPAATTIYSVQADLKGCKTIAAGTVFVVDAISPNTSFSYNGPFCVGERILLPLLPSSFVHGGTFSSAALNIDPSNGSIDLSGTAPGNYHVTYSLNASGCSLAGTSSLNIELNAPAHLTVSPEIHITKGSNATISASGASSYVWSPAEGLTCSDCASPLAHPAKTTTYCVFSPNNDCIEPACVRVIVDEEVPCSAGNLAVPNAFTPNNDHNNDEFLLHGWNNCVKEFSIQIFDRWGEKVFSSTDASFSWDGRYKGKVLESDVLVYVIRSVFVDGSSAEKKGNITLIK